MFPVPAAGCRFRLHFKTVNYDETEFDIKAYDEDELSELFKTLCKETFGEEWKKAYSSVTAVVIVQFADTYEELA